MLRSYLGERDILVVDENTASRDRIVEKLCQLEVDEASIHSTANYEDAKQFIINRDVAIIFSDLHFQGGSASMLFEEIRQKNHNSSKVLLIIVTSDMSKNAMAEAVEATVDSFILKPFTSEYFTDCLYSSIQLKLEPGPYLEKIEKARHAIDKLDFVNALTTLQSALSDHLKPSLALYYTGEIKIQQEQKKAAKTEYLKGLSYNNLHFRCLLGLFTMLKKDGNGHDAYQVGKKIVKYFPCNEERISHIIRLAVSTDNFQDMEFFFNIYQSIERKNQLLSQYIGAGMYIAGKHFLLNDDVPRALRHFNSTLSCCNDFSRYFGAIIELLIEHRLMNEAEVFLDKYESTGYKIHEFETYRERIKNSPHKRASAS